MSGFNVPSNRVHVPSSSLANFGRSVGRYNPEEYTNYIRSMSNRLRTDYVAPRRHQASRTDSVPVEKRPLKVGLADFYAAQNAIEHHTDRYELVTMQPATPVFRRGNNFYMAIRFEGRDYDPTRDIVNIGFNFGPSPNFAKGTKVGLSVGSNTEFEKGKKQWEVRVHHHEGSTLTLHVHIPATVCVGVWRCQILTTLVDSRGQKETFSCKDSIYILFNPWCKEDGVYMDDEEKLKEYVLNDVGKVYVGAFNRPSSRKWVFAQFDDVVLPACMYILELSKLDFTARGNPIKVVRAISAGVNSQDDNGVLVGRWDGDYKDGTAPYAWTGSLKILEDFMKTSGQPVMYGQCWVFSGITTTICRALGIPCRSVTNFVSAHDTDESLTVDKFFDVGGDQLDEASRDSIWNFHVWNDVWMARPDLPFGYGGWQAIDATPQEQSEDVYQAGPASVAAVQKGQIGFLYDTPFVFAEVNADVIHWQEDSQLEIGFKQMKSNNYHVGRRIYTKKINVFDDDGEDDAEDILHEYKNPEGTEEERLSVLNAARAGGVSHIYDMPEPEGEDMFFDLIEIDRITIGEPFSINVKIENRATETRNVFVILSTSSVYYTGVQAKRVKKVTADFKLEPEETELLSIEVTAEEYLDKLVDYSMMKIYAIAVVRETRQTWTEEDDFAVEKPKIDLQVEGPLKVGEKLALTCALTNPLDIVLQSCQFKFEGPGLSKPRTVNVANIQPKATFEHKEFFTPVRGGERQIIVNFGSHFLNELSGSKTILIEN